MLPKDVFARSIEYPKDFSGGVLDQEQFFQFSEEEVRKNDYALSVASCWLLKTVEAVHEYGRFVADCKNVRYKELKGSGPNPMRRYVGSYSLFAEAIEGMSLSHYSVDLNWKPEEGQDAHFQIELTHNGSGGRKALKGDRRFARAALYDARFGPEICSIASNDDDLSEIISQLDVVAVPE
jgi:hypothetical protein